MRSRILVVDDNPINVEIIQEALEREFDIGVARDGEEALRVAADFQPELILLDVMMPGLDGYEVCRRVRSNTALRHVKIIMVSAKSEVSERLEGYRAGADDYLPKPFQEDELLAKVRVFLRLRAVENVDRLKTNMLRLFLHEVNTPLDCIVQPAEQVMVQAQMDDATRRQFGEIIHTSVRRLRSFFARVIALSDIRSGSHRFRYTVAEFGAIVRGAVRELFPTESERNVRVREELRADCTVLVEVARIRDVIVAVLHNALRFSPVDGTVCVRTWLEDDHVHLSVSDEGEGIEPEYVPFLFDEFVNPGAPRWQGQGLSLALSREVVLQHLGQIGLGNSNGTGATFQVRLPTVRARGRPGEKDIPCHRESPPLKGRTIFQAEIPSNPALKSPLARRLYSEAVDAGLVSTAEQHGVTVVIEEAVDNAIVHGNRSDPNLAVYVRLYYADELWGLTVQDQGSGFDAGELQQRRGGGICLMEQLMETVEFFDGGRTVSLETSLANL